MHLSTNNIAELLKRSLDNPPIAETKNFTWLATPIGIAALCKAKEACQSPPFEEKMWLSRNEFLPYRTLRFFLKSFVQLKGEESVPPKQETHENLMYEDLLLPQKYQ